MASDIFKSVVLGLVSFGGVGTAIYFGINAISTNDDLLKAIKIEGESVPNTTNNTEEDIQYQFLYKLAKKVFPYLKGRNGSAQTGTKAVTQSDLISWLASEFDQSNHPKDDNWQNFKSLCEEQKKKDDEVTPTEEEGEDNVEVPASRVCYLDKGKGYNGSDQYEKGYLGLWETEEPKYIGFGNWTWSNLQLWEYFNHHHPDQSPLDKFDEWYLTQTENNTTNKISGVKNRLG